MEFTNHSWIDGGKRVFAGIVLFLMFYQSTSFAEEAIKIYPEIGILSENRTYHLDIKMKLIISKDWMKIENEDNLSCKWINENISMEALKKIVVFEEKDLTPMMVEKRADYDESSVYFKSCNYIDGYSSLLFTWGKDTNALMEWPNTDAYIDTEHSLLLIDYIDNDKQYVRALFIDKKHQFYSNAVSNESIWDKFKKILRQ